MIAMIQPIPAGNALRVFLEPPQTAVKWRVLRKASDTFTGEADPGALIAYEGDEKIFVDTVALQNEVMAFYKAYYTEDEVTWQPSETASGTPAGTYEEYTTDVMSFLRSRMEAGMKIEVERGSIIADELGYVQVYTAPPSMEQNLRFPLITIQLIEEHSQGRGIGETISGDEFDQVGLQWLESEGWLAGVKLMITGWSLNSDERIELRKSIRRVIVANLPVFSAKGFEQIDLQMQDVDYLNGEFGVNVYTVSCSFTCFAPIRVGNKVDQVTDVEVYINDIYVGSS